MNETGITYYQQSLYSKVEGINAVSGDEFQMCRTEAGREGQLLSNCKIESNVFEIFDSVKLPSALCFSLQMAHQSIV